MNKILTNILELGTPFVSGFYVGFSHETGIDNFPGLEALLSFGPAIAGGAIVSRKMKKNEEKIQEVVKKKAIEQQRKKESGKTITKYPLNKDRFKKMMNNVGLYEKSLNLSTTHDYVTKTFEDDLEIFRAYIDTFSEEQKTQYLGKIKDILVHKTRIKNLHTRISDEVEKAKYKIDNNMIKQSSFSERLEVRSIQRILNLYENNNSWRERKFRRSVGGCF